MQIEDRPQAPGAPRAEPPSEPPSEPPAPQGRRLHRARPRKETLVVAGVLFAVAILSWHYQGIQPEPGLDPSWQAALHLGLKYRMPFGSQLVFTYGPLGFLGFPAPWYTPAAFLALAFVATIHVAYCATVFFVARRRLGLWPSALLALLFGAITELEAPELALLVIAAWLIIGVQRTEETRLSRWISPACGALAGALLLVKINAGLSALVLVGIASWWLPPGRWRAVLRAGGAAAIAVVVGWFATGNSLGNLGAFVHNSGQIVTGYTDAMWKMTPKLEWQIPVATALIVATMVTVAFRSGPRRVLVFVLALGLMYAEYKHAFVRHEEGRVVAVFVAAALVAVLVGQQGTRRWHRVLVVAVVAAGLVLTLVSIGPHPLDVAHHAQTAGATVIDLAIPSRRHDLLEEGRRRIRKKTGVDARAEEALAGHSFHVEPYEASVAWLLDGVVAWRPAPVIQSYSAYTPDLDRLNARKLSAARGGPTRVLRLRKSITIDGRSREFETPATSLAMLCNYRVELESSAYEVLARVPDRCGVPRRVASAPIRKGQPVIAPKVDAAQVLLARVTVDESLASRVRSALFRPAHIPLVVADGTPSRLIVATSSDLLMLRVPVGMTPVPLFDQRPDHQTLDFIDLPGRARIDFYTMTAQP